MSNYYKKEEYGKNALVKGFIREGIVNHEDSTSERAESHLRG